MGWNGETLHNAGSRRTRPQVNSLVVDGNLGPEEQLRFLAVMFCRFAFRYAAEMDVAVLLTRELSVRHVRAVRDFCRRVCLGGGPRLCAPG